MNLFFRTEKNTHTNLSEKKSISIILNYVGLKIHLLFSAQKVKTLVLSIYRENTKCRIAHLGTNLTKQLLHWRSYNLTIWCYWTIKKRIICPLPNLAQAQSLLYVSLFNSYISKLSLKTYCVFTLGKHFTKMKESFLYELSYKTLLTIEKQDSVIY